MTEKDYLKMIAEGDKEAFRVIFDKYYPKVLAFLQSFLQSYDDAEDVAQSVFVRLWFVRHTLVDVTRISAYLFRMTTNMAINWSKSRKTHLDLAYGDLPYQPLTEENLDADLRFARIVYAVNHMPDRRRKVFMMSRVEGLSNSEIAERMNISRKTVENHMNLALKELRKIMALVSFLSSCTCDLFPEYEKEG